ncbi:MAG: hypothetical protein C0459_00190 [Chitinophaga sp.]|jgi:hypothetical protein|nr:hypothetical protein [Chitinophaga sp.]
MHTILLNCGNTHKQYKIVAECSNAKTTLALAGFCAEEQAENTLFRHLQNLCVQSDGSLSDTHALLRSMMQQWQTALNIPAVQVLNYVNQYYIKEQLSSVCLYKANAGGEEKLINRILL